MNKPTKEQVTHFIRESNAIEEIYHDEEIVARAWDQKQSEIEEIDGHVKAFYEMENWMLSDNFTEIRPDHIVKLHTTLMQDLLPPYWLGIRKKMIQIGGRLGPPPLVVRHLLEKWCEKVNTLEYPTEQDILQAHLAYEYIHPFMDGNGRSGRLLWLWLRYKHGYGFGCFESKTKFKEYYPLFDQFNWDHWFNQK